MEPHGRISLNGGPHPKTRSSDRRLRGIAIAATATTFLLVAIGAMVRATNSGLGCSGWPKCSPSHWLPPLEYHAVVEYSHRFTAFLDIVLIGILAVVAWRGYRGVPRVLRSALAAVALVLVQAILGGIVVKGGLAALLVTAHFGTAMILASVLVYATVASFSVEARLRPSSDSLTVLARATACATFALMAVGAYVRGEKAGLVFPTWPLMDGRLIPPLPSAPAALHFAHRLLALAVGLLVGLLALRARRERAARPAAATLALVAAGLFASQVLIGAANVWSRLAAPAVVAHVAVASLIWGAVVATAEVARIQGAGPRAARISAGALALEP
jgi:heme A synthase